MNKSKPNAGAELAAGRAVLTMVREALGDKAAGDVACRALAGLTIRFPNPRILERMINEERRVAILCRDPSTRRARQLGDLHGLELREVSKSFRKANGGIGLKDVRVQTAVGDGERMDGTEPTPARG